MRLNFTMLLYMKIQTERKHHVFLFHHETLIEDTDGEETPCAEVHHAPLYEDTDGEETPCAEVHHAPLYEDTDGEETPF